MKKYYYEEHETAYQEMKATGIAAWDQYHEPDAYTFERFMMRPFLEKALEHISLPPSSRVFEYGCGTGAGSCFLAERGFTVEAIDISPTAIEMAGAIASEKSLDIRFRVLDLLEIPALDRAFDLILDNYCLQSIVTDADRQKLYKIVQSGLKENGYYVLSSAIHDGSRDYRNSYYCGQTGIVYDRISAPEHYDQSVYIDHQWWLPKRRHLKKEALRAELQQAGFQVMWQEDGSFICTM